MKKLLILVFLGLASSALAQTTITDFSSAPSGASFTVSTSWGGLDSVTQQFTTANGILTVAPVSGGNPTDTGSFGFADLAVTSPIDGSVLLSLAVTARIDAGNAASGFAINLFDDQGLGARTATFQTSSFTTGGFTTVTVQLTNHPEGGSVATISSFGIAGTGTGGAFRMSFDSIVAQVTAIPEPSTYAAIIGALALGLVAYRRRRQQLAA